MDYLWYHYLALFFIYCLIGWIWECSYCSIRDRRLQNRGFLFGPWIPLYGSGGMLILWFTTPVRDTWPLVFLYGMLLCTLIEYLTGMVMERLFHMRYWDYSKVPLNVHGYICLGVSLVWGAFSVGMVEGLQRFLDRLIFSVPKEALLVIDGILVLLFVFDTVLSAKAAIELRDLLIAAEKMKKEARLMGRRMDVLIAVVSDEVKTRKDNLLMAGKQAMAMLARNHGAVSERYHEALGDLKDFWEEKWQKKGKTTESE